MISYHLTYFCDAEFMLLFLVNIFLQNFFLRKKNTMQMHCYYYITLKLYSLVWSFFFVVIVQQNNNHTWRQYFSPISPYSSQGYLVLEGKTFNCHISENWFLIFISPKSTSNVLQCLQTGRDIRKLSDNRLIIE